MPVRELVEGAGGQRKWSCGMDRLSLGALSLLLWVPVGCRDDGPVDAGGTETGGSDGVDDGDGDDAGSGDGTGDETGEDTDPPDFDLQAAVLPRLTERQYRNSIADLLGGELPEPAVEPDTNPYLFYSVGATSTTLSELGVQMYEEAAETLTTAVFADAERREALVGCAPTDASDPCVESFVRDFGLRAFRRPLDEDEVAQWTDLVTDVSEPDVWEGLRLTVGGMLQSPNFVYRVELGEPDPDDDTRLRFTGYEMATRLSYLLWDTTPDAELLAAAADGSLATKDGVMEQAERLLAAPRSRDSVRAFFSQYYDLSRLNGINRSQEEYPDFNSLMPDQMRAEVELLVEDVVYRQDADFRTIYSTRRTHVTNHLAKLYGIEAPGASPITFVPVDLPEDGPRGGLLTLSAFLTMNAHETETSPTLRGKYVRDRVLCDEVPAPPDDVDLDTQPDESDPQTLRERLEEHRENPVCAACHAFIDPPGFLFENFDSVGAYRTVDSLGLELDASGELDGTEMADASELGPYLAQDPRVGTCVVQQLYRHAHGRLNVPGEAGAIKDLSDRFEADGYRFQGLLLQFVTHDSFRYLAEEGAGQ